MYYSKVLVIIVLLFSSKIASSQPNTEVYLFDLQDKNGIWQVSNPINISDNEGYDNQPSFSENGQFILYARTINGQTDIAQYTIKSGKTIVITNTHEGSEYSPTPMPDKRISSIRLDTTGLQLLYAYDFKGQNKVLIDDLVIGYHAWLNETSLVAFVLGEPSTMQIINTSTGEVEVVAENIGRSLHLIPDESNHFSYIDKSKEEWTINKMNPKTKKAEVLTPTLASSEDYAWTPNNQVIIGKDSKLHLWETGKGWEEIADLSKHNITKISRIAISSDGKKLALVSE